MAVVEIAHHPELTPESAMQVFERHFAGRYEVYQPLFFPSDYPLLLPKFRDFLVQKA